MTVETLEDVGLSRMGPAAIDDCLDSERVGVLGLPTASGAPYLLPLSFGHEDGTLYFTFVGGPESRKRQLLDTAETASFLVYSVRSMVNWESVALTGTPVRVPEAEWADLADVLAGVWRPEMFAEAIEREDIALVALEVTERSGIRHTGLPSGFQD